MFAKRGLLKIINKSPVTLNGDSTAVVQRSKNLSARCAVAAKYALKYKLPVIACPQRL